ncbi:MAG TPA: hypothetical protein VFI61_00505 [Patescibacteria group bacterium]|nr:hypothetical protein [Patescibacteria group bacterium]
MLRTIAINETIAIPNESQNFIFSLSSGDIGILPFLNILPPLANLHNFDFLFKRA